MIGRTGLLIALIVTPSLLVAQPARDSARLAEVIVTAHRDSVAPRVRASAADLLSAGEIGLRRSHRLGDALRLLQGTALVGTGAPGGVASTFFRGVNSNQTLLLIDGIRVNDANTLASAFFGGFELAGNDRLEIVRGPQGTLYGGAAIGGVIAVGGEPIRRNRVATSFDAGEFASYRGRLEGAAAGTRWEAGFTASFADTENERPSNQTDQRSQSLRVAFRPTGRLEVGVTARGHQSSYASPGDLRSSNTTPEGLTTFDHLLGTVYAAGQVSNGWTSRLTLGGQGYYLEGRSRFNGSPEFVSRLKTDRRIVDWQHRVALARQVGVVAGINGEWADVTDNDGRREERLRAGYAEVSLLPGNDLAITLGARHDDYDTYGGSTTGRVGVGYFIPTTRLKLRGTFGTGFMPPSLSDRYGSPFQKANPAIRAERSRGWDLGVDQFFARDRAMISLTYFGNALRDLIGFESAAFPELGRSVNVAKARTTGVEFSSRLVVDGFDVRAGYTYLEATNLTAATPADRRLIRRPKHALSADLYWRSGKLAVGIGGFAAIDREDSDFNAFPATRVDPGNYFDASLRANWQLTNRFAARARLDNLFDAYYEEVYGFPALGRRLQVGFAIGDGR
ncbi:MAG: TonB-dependent receptor plug domain-containing protein [Gemmatimonadales bacterium]